VENDRVYVVNMRKYAFYHSGQYVPQRKKGLVKELAKFYTWRDLRKYDQMSPEEQDFALSQFAERHKINKKLENKEEATEELKKALKEINKRALCIIYRDVIVEPPLQGPPLPRSQRTSRQKAGPPIEERYQLELFV